MKAPSTYKYLPAELADGIRSLGITVRRPVVGPKEGMHRSTHYGASVEFAEYREYTPGDPPNLIDWSVYARSDRYVVRRFHEETNLRATILLDTSESLAFRDEGPMTKMDYASFLAAGLMFVLLNQGDSVGLVTFDNKPVNVFEPVGTSEGLRPLLLSLEDIKPTGRSDIEAVLHHVSAMIPARSLVIVISDMLQPADETIRGIRHLYHDGHSIMMMHLLDRGEMALSFGGVAELRELETGARMVIEVDEIRDIYRAAVESFLDELRRGCAECLAEHHLLDTRTPVAEALTRVTRQGL